jgi:hypothetical protein
MLLGVRLFAALAQGRKMCHVQFLTGEHLQRIPAASVQQRTFPAVDMLRSLLV